MVVRGPPKRLYAVIWLVKTSFNFRHAITNYTRAWGADIDVVEVDAAAVNVLVQRVSGGGKDRGREIWAGRGRTKKVALVLERRPVKTAMRVVECMVVAIVLVIVIERHFEPSLSGHLIYLP